MKKTSEISFARFLCRGFYAPHGNFQFSILNFQSETEVKVLGLDVGILLGGFGLQVDGVALYVDSLDGADEFAAAASYAQFGSGLRNGQTSLERNHVDSLYGAVLSACSATGTVHVNDTDVDVEHYAARLGLMLLLDSERLDGAGGTYLAAEVAVIVAVTFVKLHDRLHDTTQTVLHTCRIKHMAGTLAHAEMT